MGALSSANVFAHDWGMLVHGVIALVASASWVVVSVRVADRLALEGWRAYAAVAVWFVGLVACFFGSLLALPWPPEDVGEYESLFLVRGDRDVLAVQTLDVAGKSPIEYRSLLCFDLATGAELGRVDLPSREPWEDDVRIEAIAGAVTVWSSPDGFVAVDLARCAVVSREQEAAGPLGPYRTRGFDPARWSASVELQNGDERLVPMGPPPSGDETVLPVLPDHAPCGTWRDHRPEAVRVGPLLRAVPLDGCAVSGATGPLGLYVSRGTAFGEGSHLLSALTSGGELAWSVDLDRYDPVPTDVLLAFPEDADLRLFLGADQTIYEVTVEAATGRVTSERALY